MAQGDVTITVVGNLVAAPELRFTPNGAAVASFRVASTPRRYNSATNQWEDGEPMFLTCNAWRQMAEHINASLDKGTRVIVTGRLRQRSYETQNNEKRTVFELEVDEIGPSLRYVTASLQRDPGTGAPQARPAQAAPAAAPQGGFGGAGWQPNPMQGQGSVAPPIGGAPQGGAGGYQQVPSYPATAPGQPVVAPGGAEPAADPWQQADNYGQPDLDSGNPPF